MLYCWTFGFNIVEIAKTSRSHCLGFLSSLAFHLVRDGRGLQLRAATWQGRELTTEYTWLSTDNRAQARKNNKQSKTNLKQC